MGLRIGDILLEKGLITALELDIALKEQQKTKEFLGAILVRMGFITERELLRVIAGQQGIIFIDLRKERIDQEAVKRVPAKFALHYKIMPLKIQEDMLIIASSDASETWAVEDLEINLGIRVEKVLAVSQDIQECIQKYYGVGADTIDRLVSKPKETKAAKLDEDKEKIEDLEKTSADASVVTLVNEILQDAIDARATDIHIERWRNDFVLRYRIDGVLCNTQIAQKVKVLYPTVIARIKIMAGLDIVEHRLPQDGRIKVTLKGKEYDLRISIIPTLYGENIVIRILPTVMTFNMIDLGLSKENEKKIESLINKPNGIIFVTGPTGSGKSTTLYTCLKKLNTAERKIITIEDPVEYELTGVSQIQVNPGIDLTFARCLRSVLRHDPDVVMVGEIRDHETAEIAMQSALTGHLVFSTVHTNDAASGITRLIDIGVEPYLIASSAQAFIAQRLVRVICKDCKEKINLSKTDSQSLSDLGFAVEKLADHIYRGRGCQNCSMTGYLGRIAIYEILMVSEEIKQAIIKKLPAGDIKKIALKEGMISLRDDGWQKVIDGVTTPEEVIRVTASE